MGCGMNVNQARKYFCKHRHAELLVVPRRHSYILQVRNLGRLESIRKLFSAQAITCNTMEQVNEYAKKLNKMDYHLVQNCPHVEMSGFDSDGDDVKQREDLTKVHLKLVK
jgi:succinate dehydrogenase/fumarate reductase-like Fe-S protein